jgi:ATP phosphoribosyltransferase regulatory subunit
MLTQDRWLLPEGIEEIFPEEAERLECLRRKLIDLFTGWGYRQVMPPLIDFLDSLLVGAGHELDAQTFKLTDPVSGRLIGMRADMTPQVARIDARTAAGNLPSRLCYEGSVLHTLSDHLEKSRNPLQIGAELYGHAGHSAALEVTRLMLEMLDIAGIPDVHLDLGHVGIYRALAQQAGLTESREAELFEILQRKDATDLDAFLSEANVSGEAGSMIRALLDLNGPADMIADAQRRLTPGGDFIATALAELKTITDHLQRHYPPLPINLDLAELRGYHYHTGVVFAAFVPGQGREIARGGRYDDVGEVFGRARPAVGFSADLKILARLAGSAGENRRHTVIFAPALDDSGLETAIRELRARGHVVIQALGAEMESPVAMGCGSVLSQQDRQWRVVALDAVG